MGQLACALAALVLALLFLLQAPFFGRVEWLLVALAPVLYLVVAWLVASPLWPLFSRPVYAGSATARSARFLTFCILCIAWVVARYAQADAPAQPLAQLAWELQARWGDTPSAFVRWAIDANAWGQATLDSLGHLSGAPWWRVALSLVVLPLTVFGFVTWSAAGLALGVNETRRTFAAALTESDAAPGVSRGRALRYAGSAVALAAVAMIGAAQLDSVLRQSGRPLALRPLPECERIGGAAYTVGTLARLEAYHAVLESGIVDAKRNGCQRIVELQRVLALQVDAYLDWYFSFGADLTQTVLLVTGEVEALAEFKLNKLIASDPQVVSLLGQLDADQEYIRLVSARAAGGLEGVLDQQRLVLDERQCRVVKTETMEAAQWRWRGEGLQPRLIASGSGALVGGFAGALAGRAMGRTSMKAAQRVLGKAAGKAATRIGGGAVAGGAVGSVGAVPGAVVGGILGAAAAAVGIDFAMLKAEEALTRDGMRRDLLATVDETLAPLKAAFGCPGS